MTPAKVIRTGFDGDVPVIVDAETNVPSPVAVIFADRGDEIADFDEGPPYVVEHYDRWRIRDRAGNIVDDDYDTESGAQDMADEWNADPEEE